MTDRVSGSRRAKTFVYLLGTSALLSTVTASPTIAAEAPAASAVEEVLITGSAIRGAAAVGAPVTAIGAQEFRETGAITVAELLKTVPSLQIDQTSSANTSSRFRERGTYVDLHLLGSQRELMLIDGARFPGQNDSGDRHDPGIIPQLAVERIEVLAEGASALYGADAVSGVVNIILKRRFEGAISLVRVGTSVSDYGGGGTRYQASQLYGRTWDGGDLTFTAEANQETALNSTDTRLKNQFTQDYSPWGLDNRTSVGASLPGVVSTGAPSPNTGTTCTNCYSVPKGAGSPSAPVSWTTLLANKGVLNQQNPFKYADLSTPQQRIGFALTLDQRLFDGVEWFLDATYNSRRGNYRQAIGFGNGTGTQVVGIPVPTQNPFYPVGAPSGLRVSYNFASEITPRIVVGDYARYWSTGFNLELPYGWSGKIFYQSSYNTAFDYTRNAVNTNMVSAALGNTVPAQAAGGAVSGYSAFTKPVNIPYLDLFCDPLAFACNKPEALDYIKAFRDVRSENKNRQTNATFSGPLFSIPAGEVRAAVGFDLTQNNFYATERTNLNTHSSDIIGNSYSAFDRQVAAGFVQFNVPLVSDATAIPLIRRLDVEASYRVDHYSTFGNQGSPRVGVDWVPVEGLLLRSSWGKSFRAPTASEVGLVSSQVDNLNQAAGASADTVRACPVGSATPVPGSAGEVLVNLGLASCSPTAPLNLQFPGGIGPSGSAAGAALLMRPWDGEPADLLPETATNYSYGFEFTPPYVPGLAVGATYWRAKVKNFIFTPRSAVENLQDPKALPFIEFPTNPNFASTALALASLPYARVGISPAIVPNVVWLVDAANTNVGFFLADGIDFHASYDADLAEWGVGRIGGSGTYYKQSLTNTTFSENDLFDSTVPTATGVPTRPRLRYRAYVGWTGTQGMGEGLSLTVFVNYFGHYYSTNASPSAATLTACGCTSFNNLIPPFASADLAISYDTGDRPANIYLQNLNFQIVVNNVLDKHAPFMYLGGGGNPSAFDVLGGADPVGRFLSVGLTKAW